MINNNTILRQCFLWALLLVPAVVLGQQTGSFSKTITFNGEPRKLSYYVPADYNPANAYTLMVGLHGLGDSASNYKPALVTVFGLNNINDIILVCPDGGDDQLSSFDMPAGDEAIIEASIKDAQAQYNIDTTDIILQGFSLGGRSALRYGLNHPERFKGLLLNTPAIQGVKDALLNTGPNGFKYANAPQIPIYITHGANDVAYTGPIDSMYRMLVLNDARVQLVRVVNMGHTIPSQPQLGNFREFFESPAFSDYDLDLVDMMLPRRTCNTSLVTEVMIRNTGSTTLTSAEIDYTIDGNTQTYNWTGNLAPFEHEVITLPVLSASAGAHTISAEVSSLNGGQVDGFSFNNGVSEDISVVTSGVTLPYTQGFDTEDLPSDWVLQPSGDYYLPWTPNPDIKKTGAGALFSLNTILVFDNLGRREEILSPVLDLTSINSPNLMFDFAYNYTRYTPPYFTDTVDIADTLEVLVSTDCGASFQSIFRKGGSDLATFTSPIMNPLDITALLINPSASNWNTAFIDLGPYASSTNAVIKFSYISGLGGSIALDNVRFSNAVGIQSKESPVSIAVYPNPAKGQLNIRTGNERVLQVRLIDLSGRTVLATQSRSETGGILSINTSSVDAGMYLVEVMTEKGTATAKVLIER